MSTIDFENTSEPDHETAQPKRERKTKKAAGKPKADRTNKKA